MLNGSVQMCVDSKFNKYELPVFCINAPLDFDIHKIEDRNLEVEFEDIEVQVVVRSANFPHEDQKFMEHTTASIESIKESIRTFRKLSENTLIRLFYHGREIKDQNYLGTYSYKSGMVIQAMIR